AAIKWAGGSLLYDSQLNHVEPRWPRWLGDFIGVDHLDHIALVNLRSDDAMLVHVERLDCLERLSLDGSLVSDSGLMHLEGLTRLRWLNLRDTKVGDAGLDHLMRLTELRTLNADFRSGKIINHFTVVLASGRQNVRAGSRATEPVSVRDPGRPHEESDCG